MTTIKFWLDSGANAHSCVNGEFSLEDDLGISVEEWNALTDEERDLAAKDFAFETLDWGYSEPE